MNAAKLTVYTNSEILAVITVGEWLDYRDAHNLGLIKWEIDTHTGEHFMEVRA